MPGETDFLGATVPAQQLLDDMQTAAGDTAADRTAVAADRTATALDRGRADIAAAGATTGVAGNLRALVEPALARFAAVTDPDVDTLLAPNAPLPAAPANGATARVGRLVYIAQGGSGGAAAAWSLAYADAGSGSAADDTLPWLREWSAETDARLGTIETPRALVIRQRVTATPPGALDGRIVDVGTGDQYAEMVVGPLGGGAADVRQRVFVCSDAGYSTALSLDIDSLGRLAVRQTPLDLVYGEALAPRASPGDVVSIEATGDVLTVSLSGAESASPRFIYRVAIEPGDRYGTYAGTYANTGGTDAHAGPGAVGTVEPARDVRLLLGEATLAGGEPVQHVVGADGEPDFLDGWGAYGGGFAAPSFTRIGARVYLDGLMSPGTPGYGAFALPAGFQPAGGTQVADARTEGGTARVDVRSDGLVIPMSVTGFLSLSGISFPVA